MIYEIRRYELQQHTKDAFYKRFEEKLMPLFGKHGFRLVGAWDTIIGDAPETTYILAWKDLNELQQAWINLNSDADWISIKQASYKEHGVLVVKTHSQVLSPANYSPIA